MVSSITAKPVVFIDHWYLTAPNPYQPLSAGNSAVVGICHGHPHHRDGNEIVTGNIISATGLTFSTHNTDYQLGQPQPQYLEWLKTNGYQYRSDNPLWCFNG